MRVVFDTNIFISAPVIPGGRAEEAYLHVLKGDAALCTSVAILTETAQKLKTKFGWKQDRVIRLLKAIAKVATVLKTRVHLHVLTDEPDNRILECALKADAHVIVTGDKHLLTLQKYQNIPIVRLNDFLKMF